jgi:hypothetical protein
MLEDGYPWTVEGLEMVINDELETAGFTKRSPGVAFYVVEKIFEKFLGIFLFG